MLRDVAAKIILIPLLGICISLFTGLFSYKHTSVAAILFSCFYWIFITYVLWQGVVYVTAFIRNHARIPKWLFLKIFLLVLSTTVLALLFISTGFAVYNAGFSTAIVPGNGMTTTLAYVAVAPLIGLVYEIFFLHKEKELDSKIVEQLDYERQSAEMQVLKNELDPHFIFNCLTTLTPLIATNIEKAQTFTARLSQVYKYFLVNKNRDLITLGEELRFIEDYFFLLQIRHEQKLHLDLAINGMPLHQIMILPFALQTLIENAIKHNQFSTEQPLQITIALGRHYIHVSNTTNTKPYGVESTHIGLTNLSARYKLTCSRDIIIAQTKENYTVKLPFIKTTI